MPDVKNLLAAQNLRLTIFISVICLLGFGFYLEHIESLEPCPLCITQRFFLLICGCLGLIAALHNPAQSGTKIYAGIGTLMAVTGAGFASRQLYLQSLPPEQAPACGPSIDFIFQTFPLSDALSILLRGDGNCAEVTWRLLGLSIPGWTAVAFIGIALAWLLQINDSKTTNTD